MDDIADLDELRRLLKGLADRNLVVYLSEPGRRGTMVTHGFHEMAELERVKARHAGGSTDPDPTPARSASAGLQSQLNEALAEVTRLKAEVAALRAKISG